jgi:hypothetical protein
MTAPRYPSLYLPVVRDMKVTGDCPQRTRRRPRRQLIISFSLYALFR